MTVKSATTVRDQELVAKKRSPAQREALARLEKLAKAQGVKPLDFDELLAEADFWPEDESVDEFIATIRQWREEERNRELP